LKDEIEVLKGEKKRPRFKASGMEEKAGKDEKESEAGAKKRAGSEKRSKTELLEIHEERVIAPEAIPAGSRFKVTRQDFLPLAPEVATAADRRVYRLRPRLPRVLLRRCT
jgi:hypothetical protein